MRIKRGSGRIVVIFDSFVIKFCRIQPLLNILVDFRDTLSNGKWGLFYISSGMKWRQFKKGLKQNATERCCWKKTKASFLAPTYFSLGLVNIQKAVKGDEPTQREMNELLYSLGRGYFEASYIDMHCWKTENFVRNETGYHFIDYGDASGRAHTFPAFIIKWQKELAITCSQLKNN
jgi:hypothetical protein